MVESLFISTVYDVGTEIKHVSENKISVKVRRSERSSDENIFSDLYLPKWLASVYHA